VIFHVYTPSSTSYSILLPYFPQSLPQPLLATMRFASLLAVAAATIGSAIAQDDLILGFNAGATDSGRFRKGIQDSQEPPGRAGQLYHNPPVLEHSGWHRAGS
jgi:hypothetical protein